jgi:hypothetical protein
LNFAIISRIRHVVRASDRSCFMTFETDSQRVIETKTKPEEFIRALPDSGRVFIRALTATGENKDTNFVLSGVSEIREKTGRERNWPSAPDEATEPINLSQKRQ